MNEILRFKETELIAYVVKYMTRLGVPEADARIIGEVIVDADLRGVDSHGLIRLTSFYGSRLKDRTIDPLTPYEVVQETATTALIDARNGCGQVVSHKAMEMAIRKAGQSHLGMVTVRRSNHYGTAGYYAMMALKHDKIGICLTNSMPLVAPTFGRSPILGTNPICLAAPASNEMPFVLDMATSTVPIGRIKVHEKLEQPIPLGWGIGADGEVTDDPRQVQSGGPGALLPLGGTELLRGYKGYGLALMVDILCGILSGGQHLTQVKFPDDPAQAGVAHFFMAVDIAAFRPVADFKVQMDEMIRLVKNSARQLGRDRIYIAGEKEFEQARYNREHGVPLIRPVVEDLTENGQLYGVPFDLKPL